MRTTITALACLGWLGSTAQSVTNGSCTGTVGNSMGLSLPGWVACANPPNNSPDVLDMTFPSWNGGTTVSPAPSPDGGSWIGLANGVNPVEQECMTGTMTGLTVGTSYALQYWGACFGVGVGMYANGTPAIVNVNIDGNAQDFSIPMTALVWNLYSMCFVATSTTMDFTAQCFTGGGFASLDGFTVVPANGAIDVLEDDTICAGATLLLDATLPGATYSWQDGSTGPTFLVTGPGTYWVAITTTCGTGVDSVAITELAEQTLDLGPDAGLCPGATLTLTPNVAGVYAWQDGSSGATYTVSGPGTYWVLVNSACGLLSDTVVVSPLQPPQVDLGPDAVFCENSSVLLDAATPNATYLWQDLSTASTYTVTAPGTYSVQVTVDGCTGSDAIVLTTEPCDVILEMPNVFSPNGDGANDLFEPVLEQGVNVSQAFVHNRWGQLVHESNDVRRGWNGRVDSDECPEGTYFWIVRYTDRDGSQVSLSGHVTLVR